MTDFDKDSKQALVMNVEQVVQQIINGYENFEKRVSHWVQKDGIQNCWDARKCDKNRDKKWKCSKINSKVVDVVGRGVAKCGLE